MNGSYIVPLIGVLLMVAGVVVVGLAGVALAPAVESTRLHPGSG